jgi:fructose-1,6-bisphosphatase
LKINFLKTISLIGFALSSFYGISAQSTVFNIPSTDIQTPRRFYVEADFMAHFSSFDAGGYQLFGPRVVYGLSKHAEVGVNAFWVNTEPAEPIEIQPNIKFQLYKNESQGIAVSTGALAFIPVTQRSSGTTRAMIYSVASKSVKGAHGPRITLGS